MSGRVTICEMLQNAKKNTWHRFAAQIENRINRLQRVILYSSPGEGIRLEYPTIRNLTFLLLYLAANSFSGFIWLQIYI